MTEHFQAREAKQLAEAAARQRPSQATYSITTEHDPTQGEHVQWTASVTRLSDGKVLKHEYAKTEEMALFDAQEYVAQLQAEPKQGHVYYVTDFGGILGGESVSA